MIKVAHLTSVHTRYDTRIFLKECLSLARSYSVYLVVADGKGDEENDGVKITDVGAPRGRLSRIFKTTKKILNAAVKIDAAIYHLHDPELIPVALKLKRLGKIVIFDAHEDVPKQLLGKPYLIKPVKRLLSSVFYLYERWACRKMDLIITATPYIRDKFIKINRMAVDINNYPLLGELADGGVDWSKKRNYVCYVGGVTQIRGIFTVVDAFNYVQSNARLMLVGKFADASLEETARTSEGWGSVDALGFLERRGVREVLSQSVAGLVTFLPSPNHIDAQPNKMFEYMSAGVPVIASNFPLWKEIIEGNNCGLCVDPLVAPDIAAAIDYFVQNPESAEQMGRNGKQAVEQKYNWSMEEAKLLAFYKTLL